MNQSKSIHLWLFIATTFSLGLFYFRYYYTGSPNYIFLIWNLFLAFAPIIWFELFQEFIPWKNKYTKAAMFVGWLLLFPNAPYIFTDLMHLKNTGHAIPIWYDVFLIICFAFTGLIAGFYSLGKMRAYFANVFTSWTLNILTVLILFLTAFGIYLGRFLRWNSWDILNQPGNLAMDVIDRFINPMDHPRTWGVTIIFGILLNLIYWLFTLNQSSNTILNKR